MHGKTRDPSRSRVQDTLVLRRGRPRQNITPHFRLLIDGITYGIPNRRNLLPFVNKMRRNPFQGLIHLQLHQLAIGKVIRRIPDKKCTFRVNGTCPCLATPFGPFNANCAKCRQVEIQFFINQTRTIVCNIHIMPFSTNIVSKIHNTVNADRLFKLSQRDFSRFHREPFLFQRKFDYSNRDQSCIDSFDRQGWAKMRYASLDRWSPGHPKARLILRTVRSRLSRLRTPSAKTPGRWSCAGQTTTLRGGCSCRR